MRRVHLIGVVAVAAAVAAATPLRTSAEPQFAEPRFRSDIDLVTLDVCVRDRAGQFVQGLLPEDFVVFEDGRPQQITFFAPTEPLPINAVLLIDRSASMANGKLDRARAAASAFAARLLDDDQLQILTFNERATVARLVELNRLTPSGATALYDAMVLASHELSRLRGGGARRNTRDLIIVLSDGEDTSSLVGFEEVLPLLRRSGALVYGLSLRTGRDGEVLGATWPLLQLARDTGARAIGVRQIESLDQLYAQIDTEVRHMYRLGYVSNDPRADGEWRELSVQVRDPDIHVRTRAGYYAPRSPRLQVQALSPRAQAPGPRP